MKAYQNTNSVKFVALRHALRSCLFLAAGLFLSACSQDVKVANGGTASGVYTLVSVNGDKVPAKVSHEGAVLEVRSGTFTFNADGTCGTRTCFVPPSGAEATREVSATYTREGSQLNMRWKGAGQTKGTLEGDTFTMNNEGMVFTYRK